MSLPKRTNAFLALVLLTSIAFSAVKISLAATPNPGHPWTDVGDGVFAVTGPTALRTFTFPDASATVLTSNAAVTVPQGGTGLASLTANNVILGNGAAAPSFVAPGSSGNILTSNGTTWTSVTPPSAATVVTRPYMATGAVAAVGSNSLTTYKVGLFTVPDDMTVNQLAYNVGAVTTAGSYRFCVYGESGGSKLIDVTDVPTAGVNPVSVGGVALSHGNYYIAFGCATNCNNTISTFTSTATSWINGAGVPSGKKVHEGTVTMTFGTCNSTLPTVTGSNSVVPVVRLDN